MEDGVDIPTTEPLDTLDSTETDGAGIEAMEVSEDPSLVDGTVLDPLSMLDR